MSRTGEEVCRLGITLMDNTSLNLNDTEETIDKLCKTTLASEPYPAAVCIYPKFVPYVRQKYPSLQVATVVNFPSGREDESDMLGVTKKAVEAGVHEVDMVIDYHAIISNKDEGAKKAEELVEKVRAVCPDKVLLKVIIESGELKEPALIEAASLAAIKGGADFIKTSTGKVPVNATLEAAKVMLTAIESAKDRGLSARVVGFKAAGGVKTLQQTREFIELADKIMGSSWVSQRTFRFGASSLLAVLRKHLEEKSFECASVADAGY